MSSTKRIPQRLRLAKELPIGEGAAATPAADAVGDAARAVAAAEAAAGAGAVAVGARSERFLGEDVEDGPVAGALLLIRRRHAGCAVTHQ
jgi:hypothetical protein